MDYFTRPCTCEINRARGSDDKELRVSRGKKTGGMRFTPCYDCERPSWADGHRVPYEPLPTNLTPLEDYAVSEWSEDACACAHPHISVRGTVYCAYTGRYYYRCGACGMPTKQKR